MLWRIKNSQLTRDKIVTERKQDMGSYGVIFIFKKRLPDHLTAWESWENGRYTDVDGDKQSRCYHAYNM